ncbi:MAG: aldo/keto reductase [Gemmatimonadaceae bacterium]|nr:aldo/keto reductase [Gemmatimonadaceae bacterium]NUO93270.1 aldo/keto reductase [Gemmatimonadaceae bacterium]NUP55188.1 aldo/keto reductase [Gemmatimonadaceae bacterium]NUP72073.1 aldo/keto reductase [Gemmatimonadaceae bacterium]NUR34389.1 aldo/keto reductase [Gemmatimonadaceae bacterium]
MSRRTTGSAASDEASLTRPVLTGTSATRRNTRQATTAGTRRFAARAAGRSEEFLRMLPRNLVASALGMGTYLGDCSDVEDAAYTNTVRAAIASGVNVLDTAINYRCQRSERAVGHAIAEAVASGAARRDELIVCTKGGYVALDGEPPSSREAYERWLETELFATGLVTREELVRGGHAIAPRYLAYQLARSRANLGLQTIDLYYVHNPEEQLLAVDRATFRQRLRAAFALLEERAAAGEIGGYGCATWNGLRVPPEHKQHLALAELIALARDVGGTTHHFRVVQLPVSLAMPEAARLPTQPLGRKLVPLLEAADALGVGVVASAPMMQGRLATGLPAEVHELFPSCTTDAQRALRFASSLPGVNVVLAGMRRPEHLAENLDAWRA